MAGGNVAARLFWQSFKGLMMANRIDEPCWGKTYNRKTFTIEWKRYYLRAWSIESERENGDVQHNPVAVVECAETGRCTTIFAGNVSFATLQPIGE